MTNSVDPDQTLGPSCLLLYLNLSVILGNSLQQTTSADVTFQMHFFLGPLSVKRLTIKEKKLPMWDLPVQVGMAQHHSPQHTSLCHSLVSGYHKQDGCHMSFWGRLRYRDCRYSSLHTGLLK